MPIQATKILHLKHLLFVWCLLLTVGGVAQNITMPASGRDTVSLAADCSINIYDAGGANGNYTDNSDSWLRIVSADGTPLTITGSYFIEYGDDCLTFYDGDIHAVATYSGLGNINAVARTGVLVVHFKSNSFGNRWGYNLTIAACDTAALDVAHIAIDPITATSATLHWDSPTGEGPWLVQYGNAPSALIHTDTASSTTHTISNLPEYSVTYAGIRRLSDSNDASCRWKLHTLHTLCSTPRPAKIDYDNLISCYVKPSYGLFDNPEMTGSPCDLGSHSSLSHHTIHSDTNEYDPRTGNLLRTVPQGYATSVRLGNWHIEAEAESITYEYLVDTLNGDLLIMKYAVVLQNPAHSHSEQPHFRFQILDSTGGEIDNHCYSADFVANASLGWNMADSNVVWKDWTTLGVDLTPLHGQVIQIKLTTYDCSQGGHFGYAYFVFDNSMKALTSSHCGELVSNTFTAPDGFRYQWYRSDAPTIVLDTTRQLSVDQAGEYHCQLTFAGSSTDANCSFVMTALAGNRYPTALFDWSIVDSSRCDSTTLRLMNHSVISRDSSHRQLTALPCEQYEWRIDGSLVSTEPHPLVALAPGLHNVQLVARLAAGSCGDTLTKTIVISNPNSEHYRYDTLVENQLPYQTTFGDQTFVLTTTGANTTPSSFDTLAHFTLANWRHCDSMVHYHLHVWRNRQAQSDSTVCDSQLPLSWNNKTFVLPDSITPATTLRDSVHLATTHGADSLLTMTLQVQRSSSLTRHDTLVENQLPITLGGITFDASQADDTPFAPIADSCWTIVNHDGCDSMIHYTLHIWRNVAANADSTLCDSQLPITWNGIIFALPANPDNGTLTLQDNVLLSTTHNADSLLTMTLRVRRNSSLWRHDTLVENQLPVIVGGVAFAAGHHVADTEHETVDTNIVITNANGCDSTIHYNLHVWRNQHSELDSTICNNQLPVEWNDVIFTPIANMETAATPIDTIRHLTTRHGADSLLYMHMTIYADYECHDTVGHCRGDMLRYGSLAFHATHDTTADLLLSSRYGCDSMIHLSVQVHPVYQWHNRDTICHNELPYIWLDTIIAGVDGNGEVSTIANYQLAHTTRHGCDSIHTLTLVAHPVDNENVKVVQCDGRAYTWEDGITYHSTTYAPSITYSNRYGCDSTLRLILDIVEGFTAAMRVSPERVSYESNVVQLNDISNSHRRRWYVGAIDGHGHGYPLLEDTSRHSTFTFPPDADSVGVLLVAHNAAGCRDSVSSWVIADRGIFWVPNAFTPDENSNNRFNITGNNLSSGEVWIYNRQGLYITHFTIDSEGWDGTHKGTPCPQGAYTWKLRYTTQSHPHQAKEALGTVLLIR